MRVVSRFFAAFALFVVSSASEAAAGSILSSATTRAGFTFGNIDDISFDGPGYNQVSHFLPFISGEYLEVESFTGGTFGTSHTAFLLSEVAGYADRNEFGLIDGDGNFLSMLGGDATPGSSAAVIQGATDSWTFGLKSPEGLFNSDDDENPNDTAHIIAVQVLKDGVVNIPRSNLAGAAFSFNLLAGDIVLFMEDLLYCGNPGYTNCGNDFDFNDMVVVIRSNEIPEPSTVLLLGSGLFAGLLRRRRA